LCSNLGADADSNAYGDTGRHAYSNTDADSYTYRYFNPTPYSHPEGCSGT
jgi:hypothetical protein